MKKVLIFVLMFLFIASVTFASQASDSGKKAPSPAQLAHQEKMKTCNKEAKANALKGDARKAFMKSCLSGKASAEPVTTASATVATKTQQDKMKACKKEAKDKALKGDDRKKFMNDCLKS